MTHTHADPRNAPLSDILWRRWLQALLVMACVIVAWPQAHADGTLDDPGTGKVKSYYKGYSWRVDEEGDSMIVYHFIDIYVYQPITFKNKKEREEYDRLARNVRITLPYAKLIAETLLETYEYLETLPTQEEKDKFLKNMEKEVFNQYKPVLKRFSRTQAKVLIKLIQRETNQSSYEIVKAFLGTFRATFWQGFGKLFGVSLKSNYDPNKNTEDARIERIANLTELGLM